MIQVLNMCLRCCLVVFAALVVAGCSGSAERERLFGGDSPTSSSSQPYAPFSKTDQRVGDGAEAKSGLNITVNYTGWLYDPIQPERKGRQFDTTTGRSPFTFVLGAGRTIAGWEQGVPGMKVGGLRRLIIPPELAYGSSGSGSAIPGNTTLVFDIELLSVEEVAYGN